MKKLLLAVTLVGLTRFLFALEGNPDGAFDNELPLISAGDSLIPPTESP